MSLFKKMYLCLFNAITDALELLQNKKPAEAAELLRNAQKATEEMYIVADRNQ